MENNFPKQIICIFDLQVIWLLLVDVCLFKAAEEN